MAARAEARSSRATALRASCLQVAEDPNRGVEDEATVQKEQAASSMSSGSRYTCYRDYRGCPAVRRGVMPFRHGHRAARGCAEATTWIPSAAERLGVVGCRPAPSTTPGEGPSTTQKNGPFRLNGQRAVRRHTRSDNAETLRCAGRRLGRCCPRVQAMTSAWSDSVGDWMKLDVTLDIFSSGPASAHPNANPTPESGC